MKALQISTDLSLPIRAVTEKLAFLGRTGSGKTYAAQKLAEEMHTAGAQFVVLDPVGVWYGLRLAKDGKAPGLPIPVLGGLRGDIPLEATGGALIADLVVDRGTSIVLDVSQCESDADKARFAQAFADRFFFRKKAKPSAVHVFIEECQEFVPQNPQREDARMLHAFTRMVKIGRNFGIGISLISQRPQEVNKKVLNLSELLFAFQLTGPQERKTIEGWIADKGIDEDIAGVLPKLAVGQPHVWSPAWLKVSKVIAIASKSTYDASSTPVLGKQAAARELSPIDLEQLRAEMAATIEKAKAEDPRELRRRIAQLEQELRKASAAAPVKEKPVEVPILRDVDLKRIEAAAAKFENVGTGALEVARKLHAEFVVWRSDLSKPPVGGRTAAIRQQQGGTPPARILERATAVMVSRKTAPTSSTLPAGERTILIAIAQHGDRGVTREQLTVLTGYKKSSRDTYVYRLRERGFVTVTGERIVVAAAGIEDLGADYEPLPVGEELRAYWMHRLPEGERKIFAVVVDAYPQSIDRDRITERTGYQKSSRDTYLYRLRARQLVIDTGRGHVIAAEELFG